MLGRICVFQFSGVSVVPHMESILKVAYYVFPTLVVIGPDSAQIGTKSLAKKTSRESSKRSRKHMAPSGTIQGEKIMILVTH